MNFREKAIRLRLGRLFLCPEVLEAVMSLKDRFDAARGPVKTSFERWVDSLDQEDRKAIFLAAPDEGISHRAFLDAVKAEGSGAGYDRVIAWRKEQGFGRSSK